MISISIKELLRQPKRFFPVGGALTLLVVLLVVLGGFLDGLELSQIGLYRAYDGDVMVLADDAQRQLGRSELPGEVADGLESMDEVDEVASLDTTFAVANVDRSLEDIVLVGYDLATDVLPSPPVAGEAVVDAQLQRQTGLEVGDEFTVANGAETLKVAAIVDNLTVAAPSVWVTADEFTRLAPLVNPGAIRPPGMHEAFVVRGGDDVDLAKAINDNNALDGVEAITIDEAIGALSVVQQQSSTFQGIIVVTFIITLMVIALFFALITLERMRLYAVLKAIGGRTSELLTGVSVQAICISAIALVFGFLLSALFVAFLPPELPIRIEPNRLIQIAGGTLITALLGSLFTARRLISIDPASAIG